MKNITRTVKVYPCKVISVSSNGDVNVIESFDSAELYGARKAKEFIETRYGKDSGYTLIVGAPKECVYAMTLNDFIANSHLTGIDEDEFIAENADEDEMEDDE